MRAGVAKVDITPTESIWMEGMLRAHRSEGIHDPIFAKALILSNDARLDQACAIVAVDVCGIPDWLTADVRRAVEQAVGIPANRTIIAAKHIHSGPDTDGEGEPEVRYTAVLKERLFQVVQEAAGDLQPAKAGSASGRENTISQYRRLLADDGHVVMNWEPWPLEQIVAVLGVPDPEVGVLKVENLAGQTLCILFNHAGHPNVLSGDNYLISAEYPGHAERLLEGEFGGIAMFVNGAQGTMDIDGLGPRDWIEMERIGAKLAAEVSAAARSIDPHEEAIVRCASLKHGLPARKVSEEQLAWAKAIIEETGGTVQPLADGVGDDFKALLLERLYKVQDQPIPAEHICIAIDDTAFFSFPGELFTEIGLKIKAASPFARTYIIDLANGSVGYIPSRKAIGEGGYAVDVRRVDAEAEDVILSQSQALLEQVYQS
ncbi:MAG TPA: hypothetical protein VLY63_09870 [Anaerolineae bacterium]|nr:hypothetical protein [Anaerolineae bacterium]